MTASGGGGGGEFHMEQMEMLVGTLKYGGFHEKFNFLKIQD